MSSVVAMAVAGAVVATPAAAGDWYKRETAGSVKDAPVVDTGRKFEWSVNGGLMSDYVFRGLSQNDEDPSFYAGADISYGIFYAGIWAAMVDPNFVGGASAEVDWYGGIKPKFGIAEFDLGFIAYHYPNSDFPASDGVDYVELKAGVSAEWQKLSGGFTYYYSPDYTFATGQTHVFEGTLGYSFRNVWIFEPSIDGTFGHLTSADSNSGQPDYSYWNAGLALAVEKLTFDFRYWDSDLTGTKAVISSTGRDLGDERFVFTVGFELP